MTVAAAVAVVNLILGTAYSGYGVMTALEMRRDRESFGFSHFGLAWIFMAFTCGPHHLAHGLHVAFDGHDGGILDLVAVVIGLPVGVIWLLLRVEAFRGGRGDRFIPGTPAWLGALRDMSIGYLVAVTMIMIAIATANPFLAGDNWNVVANGLLVVIYMAIGWFVLRTQLANRPSLGGWSVSGLCLAVIFPTCALMHGVFAMYTVAGRYHHDLHSAVIDWLSVPAGLYFLWVVRRLYQDALNDWNAGPAEVTTSAAVRPTHSDDSISVIADSSSQRATTLTPSSVSNNPTPWRAPPS